MKQPSLILATLLTKAAARKQGKQSSLLTIPTFPSNSHNLHSIDYSRYSPPGLRSYDPSNPNTSCYIPLYESDTNQNGAVDREEYVAFIEALEPRLVDDESFRDLAFVLKVNFVYLSCLCEDGGNNCCNVGGDGSISTAGSSPDETPTESQIQYLDTVCSTTQASIDYALKELPPTLQPTEEPTAGPSYVTTDSPVVITKVPSVSPSYVPTASKVVTTDAPTYMERTDSPAASNAPNISPAPTPSNGNVVPPTSSSGEPTLATSSPSFTNRPSIAPSTTDRAIDGGSEDTTTTTTTLSSGGIAGIVIASVAVVAAGIIISRKRSMNEEDPSLEFKGDKDLEMGDLGGSDPGPSPTNADADSTSAAPDVVPPSPDRLNTLQLSPPLSPALAPGPYSPERLDLDSDDDSSSSAGQSGWSSSQGLSSLNTASFDAGEDGSMLSGGATGRHIAAGGSALAAIGVASAVTYSTVKKSSPPQKMVKQSYADDDDGSISSEEGMAAAVSRKDLDAAIEAGDWAAVGATAALLAHTNEKERGSSSEDPQVAERNSQVSNVDYSRTKELDRLVEAGDWEGVVLAAAQFEGESDADDGTSDQVLDDGSEPSLLARGRDTKLESIRNEVELLVRRIVPDELDNIDEMMIQFEGREHELIETLKTMQERSIAQRARAAVQQSAKLEAKARGHVSSGGGDRSISSASKSYIEQAIEKGDWQAVGQAAAMMGGGSPVIEDDSFDRSRSSSISSSLSDSRSRSASRDSTLSRDKSERIQHLDNLIAVGDWAGIVAVASQYQAMDEEIGQSPPVDANLATEEERDALAQAEMWRAIAQQSKQDISSTSEGAKEAADWAISRSLAKHSAPTLSMIDQPDTKIAKIETYEDEDQSV